MTSENLLTFQGLLIISNRNSVAQGLPCLMKSAERSSENFEKIAMTPSTVYNCALLQSGCSV